MPRTVAIKEIASSNSLVISLQDVRVKPGFSARGTRTIHIVDVPDEVEDMQALRLYRETAVYFANGSDPIVSYADLSPGKLVRITTDDYVTTKEAFQILGWDYEKNRTMISVYLSRGKFPEPDKFVGKMRMWKRTRIEEYRDSKKEQ